MSLSLSRKGLVFVVVGLFLVSSFSAVIGLGANQTSYSSDNMDSEDGSSQEATLHPVSAIDVDEDLDEKYFTYDRDYLSSHSLLPSFLERDFENEMKGYYDDYYKVLEERYPSSFEDYLMNRSHFAFDEHFEDYHPNNKQYESNGSTPKPNFAAGKTWYVDDDGGQDFTRIQDAINASSDGDTVFVYRGIYYENLEVDKSIILQGEDRENTVIDGDGNKYHDVVFIDVDWVSIFNFTVTNGGEWCGDAGIELNSNNNTIARNIIENNYYGIRIDYSNAVDFSDNNTITANTITDNNYIGIWLRNSVDNTITGNAITDNNNGGIWFTSSSGNIITGNNVDSNEWGISLNYYGSSGNIITGNNVNGNQMGGIYLYDSSGNIITGNNVNNNNYEGIDLLNSRDNTITENNIDSNQWGIKLKDYYSSGNTITGNNITGNNKAGIVLSSYFLNYAPSDNTINENDVTGNFNGILLVKVSTNNVTRNHCCNNKIAGIRIIDGSGFNIVQLNDCENNMAGISVIESCNNSFCNNFCEENQYGISLMHSDENTLTENNCSNNNCGIELRNSSLNKINRCAISNNAFWGIYSFNSKFNYITRCNFIANNDRFNITHYEGEPGDKHFFYRNYWSGRQIQLPIPYLIHVDVKSFRSLFPLKPLTFNWDWFPKATPYNYDYESDWSNI